MIRAFLLSFLMLGALLRGEEEAPKPVPVPVVLDENTWVQEDVIDLNVIARRELLALGDTVNLAGEYQEDVWAGGRRVTFQGQAAKDARLGAWEVLTVDGAVAGGLRAHSLGNMLVNTNTVVRGHTVLSSAKNLTVHGEFGGDLRVEADRVVIDARIAGTLTVGRGELILLPGSRVGGDLRHETEREPSVPQGVLAGEVTRVIRETPEMSAQLAGARWKARGILLFTSFVVGLMMVRILPRFAGNCVENLLTLQATTPLTGVFAVALLGFSGLAFLTSSVGSGLGVFFLVLLVLLLFLGVIAAALALGAMLVKHRTPLTFFRLSLGLLSGLLILHALFALPVAGLTLWLLVSSWGAGAIVQTIRASQRVLKLEIPENLRNTPPDSTP